MYIWFKEGEIRMTVRELIKHSNRRIKLNFFEKFSFGIEDKKVMSTAYEYVREYGNRDGRIEFQNFLDREIDLIFPSEDKKLPEVYDVALDVYLV